MLKKYGVQYNMSSEKKSIQLERKQWRENSLLNVIAVKKLSNEIDKIISKQPQKNMENKNPSK